MVTHPHIKLSVEVMHSNKGEDVSSLSHTRTHSLKEQSVNFCKILPSAMKTCVKIDIRSTHPKKRNGTCHGVDILVKRRVQFGLFSEYYGASNE